LGDVPSDWCADFSNFEIILRVTRRKHENNPEKHLVLSALSRHAGKSAEFCSYYGMCMEATGGM
jgi:AraC-like DNA-binding protein